MMGSSFHADFMLIQHCRNKLEQKMYEPSNKMATKDVPYSEHCGGILWLLTPVEGLAPGWCRVQSLWLSPVGNLCCLGSELSTGVSGLRCLLHCLSPAMPLVATLLSGFCANFLLQHCISMTFVWSELPVGLYVWVIQWFMQAENLLSVLWWWWCFFKLLPCIVPNWKCTPGLDE